MSYRLYLGDCLAPTGLPALPDGTVDLVLVDLPYGVTNEPWDRPLDLPKLWAEYLRVARLNAAFIFFAKMPFTADLVNSNRELFKYALVWEKDRPSGHLNAKHRPMAAHEDIVVFYRRQPTYHPQMTEGSPAHTRGRAAGSVQAGKVYRTNSPPNTEGALKYPRSVLHYARPHPQIISTQKPVPLLAYLIRTFSNPNDLVLDNVMGSGSTGVACLETGRRFMGMEIANDHYEIAVKRLEETHDEGVHRWSHQGSA